MDIGMRVGVRPIDWETSNDWQLCFARIVGPGTDHPEWDTVEVEVGETGTVNFSELIGHDVVSRHQNGGYDCRIDGEIVDMFGDVAN